MDEKKQLILKAAMKVFAEVGYHRAKISKIAEIAGVGAGSVYLYFSNKENIIEEIFVEAWSIIENEIRRLTDIEDMAPDAKLGELIAGIVRMAMSKPDLSRLILGEHSFWNSSSSDRVTQTVDNVRRMLVSLLEDGSHKGCFRPDLNCSVTGSFIIGGLWHTISSVLESHPDARAESIHSEIYSLVLNGIYKLK